MDQLKLNTIHRFSKHSPQLLFEQHDRCEVPAGCGGVAFRWLNPAREAYLHVTLATPRKAEVFLDGIGIHSTAFCVPIGRHCLAVHLENASHFWLAVQRNRPPHQKTLLLSGPGQGWKATCEPPEEGWASGELPQNWLDLPPLEVSAKDWLSQRAEELGARPMGFAKGNQLWVRIDFELNP